jgi:hypothetical protein
MNETNFINGKNNLPTSSIVFLLIVIFITVSLFFYNYYLDKKNNKILWNINSRELAIEELNSDPKIQVYSLLESNYIAFIELEKRNKITTYINHLKELSRLYLLKFEWFNFSDWKLSTKVLSETSSINKLWYNKTVDFIREYRESEKSLFNLEFINSIQWNLDEHNYNITLSLK